MVPVMISCLVSPSKVSCKSKKQYSVTQVCLRIIDLQHDKTDKMTCVPSEDSDQPGRPPSPIRVFDVCRSIRSLSIRKVLREDSDQPGHQTERMLKLI